MMMGFIVINCTVAVLQPINLYCTFVYLPGVTLPQFKALMERCWAPDHKDRPTFREIVDVIQVNGSQGTMLKYIPSAKVIAQADGLSVSHSTWLEVTERVGRPRKSHAKSACLHVQIAHNCTLCK
jgi:hypothetical protein